MAQVIVGVSFTEYCRPESKVTFVDFEFTGIKSALAFCQTTCGNCQKVNTCEKGERKAWIYKFHVDGEDVLHLMKPLEGIGGHA